MELKFNENEVNFDKIIIDVDNKFNEDFNKNDIYLMNILMYKWKYFS
jgi:hypothetical protein